MKDNEVASSKSLLKSKFIFQKDNDLKHTSKFFKKYLVYKNKENKKWWHGKQNPDHNLLNWYGKNLIEH